MIKPIIAFLIKREYFAYLLFLACTAILLLLTLLPPDNLSGPSLFQYDKAGHFLMFFGWTFMLGLSRIIRKKQSIRLWVVFLLGALFGIAIEVTQGLLPYDRSPGFYDVIADLVGSFFAVFLLRYIQTNLPGLIKKSKSSIK
ncbi:MAG: VanZ family protein [Balneolaceae bacterium]